MRWSHGVVIWGGHMGWSRGVVTWGGHVGWSHGMCHMGSGNICGGVTVAIITLLIGPHLQRNDVPHVRAHCTNTYLQCTDAMNVNE